MILYKEHYMHFLFSLGLDVLIFQFPISTIIGD